MTEPDGQVTEPDVVKLIALDLIRQSVRNIQHVDVMVAVADSGIVDDDHNSFATKIYDTLQAVTIK